MGAIQGPNLIRLASLEEEERYRGKTSREDGGGDGRDAATAEERLGPWEAGRSQGGASLGDSGASPALPIP